MARRIGVLGGTFNPIHIAHLRSAIEVVELMALDELRLIPNAMPPHRELPKVTAQDRLAMVRLAVQDIPKLVVDAQELERDKLSYTFDTLFSIRSQLKAEDQLFFVMGMDAFCGLPTWYCWQELLNYSHILILQRIGMQIEVPEELQDFLAKHLVQDITLLTNACGNIAYIKQTPIDISASYIRDTLKQKKSVRFLLPDSVLEYIKKNQFYQS